MLNVSYADDEALKEIKRVVHSTFTTTDGAKFLSLLEEHLFNQNFNMQGSCELTALQAAFYQGQKNLYSTITNMMVENIHDGKQQGNLYE